MFHVSFAAIGRLVATLVSAAVVAWIYVPTSLNLWALWQIDPNYSHGPIVVVVSLMMALSTLRRGRDSASDTPSAQETFGSGQMIRCVFGLMFHFVGLFIGSVVLDAVGLTFILMGLAATLGGPKALRQFRFPILFLLFAAPLPVGWYQPVAIVLQQIVSGVSTHLLNVVGVAAFREGYMIHLATMSLEVGEACSGLRQLTAIVALAAALGFFSGRGLIYRWTLAVAAVPIAVLSNCLRVLLTGIVCQTIGRQWAEGVFHELEGIALVGLSAILLYGLAVALGRWADALSRRRAARAVAQPSEGAFTASGTLEVAG
jgi:exosortase